jgi:hypothetical protein
MVELQNTLYSGDKAGGVTSQFLKSKAVDGISSRRMKG